MGTTRKQTAADLQQLEKEFQYYLDNRDELVAKHNGKTLIIRGLTVVGAYDSEDEARREARRQFPIGTYIIHSCAPFDESEIQRFHSRAHFA